MKKYWQYFKINLASGFEYRGVLVVYFLAELIILTTSLFLWSAIYRGRELVGDYSFFRMALYFLLVPFVGALTSVFLSDSLPRKIKDGEISMEIIKPYNFSFAQFFRPLAEKIVQQSFKLPLFFIFLVFLYKFFQVEFNPGMFLLGLTICVFSYVLNFFLDLCICYAAFWMDDVWALGLLKMAALMVFGGLAFPLDLVPISFRFLFDFLPFQFTYFFPIKVIQGTLSFGEIVPKMLLLFGWAVIFLFLSKVLWDKGLEKYGAYGN